MSRRQKYSVGAIIGLILLMLVAIKWRYKHEQLIASSAIANQYAIVAAKAWIANGYPTAQPPMPGWSTLIVVGARPSKSKENQLQGQFIIVPTDPWVIGIFEGSGYCKDPKLETDIRPMLPSKISIFEVQDDGSYRRIQSGRANFVEVR